MYIIDALENKEVLQQPLKKIETRDQCYDFKNIFGEKLGKMLAFLRKLPLVFEKN
jgi:hypothetical protein